MNKGNCTYTFCWFQIANIFRNQGMNNYSGVVEVGVQGFQPDLSCFHRPCYLTGLNVNDIYF